MHNFIGDKRPLLQSTLVCLRLVEKVWCACWRFHELKLWRLWHNRLCSSPLLREGIKLCQTQPDMNNPLVGYFPTKSLPFQQWSHLLSSCGCSCLYYLTVLAHHQELSETGQTGILIKKIDINIPQISLQTTAELVQTIWAIVFTIPLSDF